MASEAKPRWTEAMGKAIGVGLVIVGMAILIVLFLNEKSGAHHLGGIAVVFLGIITINGKIWPRIGRAFCKYNQYIKMMPHM